MPWIVVLLSIEYVSYIVPNSFTTIFFLKSHPDVKCKMTFLYLTLLPSLETGYNYNADKQKILCHLGQARLRFLLQLEQEIEEQEQKFISFLNQILHHNSQSLTTTIN